MATNTAGTAARQLPIQAVHFLRKGITFADRGVNLTVGIIPAGSLILAPISGVHVLTAFNGGGTDLVDIGTAGTPEQFGANLDVSSTGVKVVAVSANMRVSVDTTIIASYADANGDASTGDAEIVIAYVPDIDG